MSRSIARMFVGASLIGAAPLAAQSRQFVSVQVAGLLMSLSGRSGASDQFAWKTGFGGEAQLRFNPSAFSIGVGAQYTSHGGSVEAFSGDKNKVVGVFV